MTTYYIDPTAPGGGNGSRATPYNVLPGTLVAGNEYLFRATKEVTGQVYVGQSGSAGNPIRLGTYGEGDHPARVNGGGTTERGININTGVHDIVVEDMDIYGQTSRGVSTYTTSGSVSAAANITLRRLTIHDLIDNPSADVDGIAIYGSGNVIEDCEIHDVPTDGIWASAQGIQIRRTRIYRVSRDGRNLGDCIQFFGDIGAFAIEDCVLDHADVAGKQCFIINGSAASGGVLRRNRMYGNNDPTHVTCYPGQQGVLIEDNYLVGGVVCGNSPANGAQYIGNLIENSYGRGLDITAQDSVALHNRIRGAGTSIGIRNNSANSGVLIARNAVSGFAQGIMKQGATEAMNSVWDCTATYVDQTGAAASPGTGSTTSRPTATTIAMAREFLARGRVPELGFQS